MNHSPKSWGMDRRYQKISFEEAKARVLELFRKTPHRPVLIGEAALLLGPMWTLGETESLLAQMRTEGVIRKTVPSDFLHKDRKEGYVLV